jgi:hypothetical protein
MAGNRPENLQFFALGLSARYFAEVCASVQNGAKLGNVLEVYCPKPKGDAANWLRASEGNIDG